MQKNWKCIFVVILISISASATTLAESRCKSTPKVLFASGAVSCSSLQAKISDSVDGARPVVYQIPVGDAPDEGWPVAIIYQGSYSPINDFDYRRSESFGLYYEGKTIERLLNSGYAVIAPRAERGIYWQTNTSSESSIYEESSDYTFLTNLFEAIEKGRFGPLNSNRMYATGFSSGGYNTSRMAVSFPGKFKALAIQSGSYANCLGPLCQVPKQVPANHPPTLFLHGLIDPLVPWFTMNQYYDLLLFHGIKTKRFTSLSAGHKWLSAAPKQIVNWFKATP